MTPLDTYVLNQTLDDSPGIYGSTVPRLWTPPLVELTPETSYGFEVCEFARRIERPLDPWQEWLVIHVGELLPDGRPRFRRVLVLVSRQNGKTEIMCILTLFWMFEQKHKLILGTSTNVVTAKESWQRALDIAESVPELDRRIPVKGGIRRAAGEIEFLTNDKCRYKVAASNRRGGRGLPLNRLVSDEFREHDSYEAYNAAYNALRADPYGQAFFISNAGDDRAVVLKDLRKAALGYIDDGTGDERLGLFEWSAPDGSDPEDVSALVQANPNVGYRFPIGDLLSEASTAKAAGGEALAGFKTEAMCMDVPMLNPAVDAEAWTRCHKPGELDMRSRRVAFCFAVSLDGKHVSLLAAALEPGGVARLGAVAEWSGDRATLEARQALYGLVRRAQPAVFGWFPNGPTAALAADLKDPKKMHGQRTEWPPRGVKLEEIRAEVHSACMGFADTVKNGMLVHSDERLINEHVLGAQKKWTGNTWVFTMRGEGVGDVDGAYAAAGAVHLAKTLPPPRRRVRVRTANA